MTMLKIYIPDEMVGALIRLAKDNNQSSSKYLSDLIEKAYKELLEKERFMKEDKCQYTIPGYLARTALNS